MKNTKSKKPTFDFKGYVPFVLSASDKRDYLKWRENIDITWVFSTMDLLLKSGYAIRLSYSEDRMAYISQLQCIDSKDQPSAHGYILSSFSPSAAESLILTLYKHSIILKGIWMTGGSEGTEQWG